MGKHGVAAAVYQRHEDADQAVRDLTGAGIDIRAISVVGKGIQTEEHPVGFFTAGDRTKIFTREGAFWGPLGGILFGSFLMFIPVFGHLIILGPLAATIVSGLEGAVLGGAAGALVSALTGIGIPREAAVHYEAAVKSAKYVVTVQGSTEDIQLAETTLRPSAPERLDSYPAKEPAAG